MCGDEIHRHRFLERRPVELEDRAHLQHGGRSDQPDARGIGLPNLVSDRRPDLVL
jgi:hypothetical protein